MADLKKILACGCWVALDYDRTLAVIYCPTHAAAPALLKELIVADAIICHLCKQVNPQHAAREDYPGCESCEERVRRLEPIAQVKGEK